MLKIENITYNDSKSLFEIIIEDEKIFISYEELEDYKFSVGMDISFDVYKELSVLSNKNLGFCLALKYTSSRLISSHKLRDYLRRKDIDNDSINMIIEELQENGIINDELYLEYYISDKMNLNLWSKKQIYFELLKIGFKGEKIDLFLEDYTKDDEVKVIKKTIDSKKLLTRKGKDKTISYLARKGFNFDLINSVLYEYELE